MSDDFVPLAVFLRPPPVEPELADSPPKEPEQAQPRQTRAESDENLRAARLFRAALADALDVAVAQLLRTIASDVLARELRLDAPAVAGIVASALERHPGEKVLSIRAHPADMAALAQTGLERIPDDGLQPGDVIIELHSGTIDLTLGARLDAALSSSA